MNLNTKVHLLIPLMIFCISGCAPRSSSPYATPSSVDRNSIRAQELTQRAVELMDTKPDDAEMFLREALAADAWYGPAHNNLAVIHLRRGHYYEAANEFEWARKLMPGHPDPRMNLALTLEHAGRIDEALCTYETALEVYPGHIPTMQAIARLQIRHQRTNDHTSDLLEEIALSGETAQWREWAQHQITRRQNGPS